jgi:hypothetical protein
VLLSWHCIISWWCPHIGRCCHHQPHSSWFISQIVHFQGVAAMVTGQAKDGLYYDQFVIDMFFLLTMEGFKCLHQQLDKFLHWCANMAWGAKGIGSLLLWVLRTFYRQRVSMALQCA